MEEYSFATRPRLLIQSLNITVQVSEVYRGVEFSA